MTPASAAVSRGESDRRTVFGVPAGAGAGTAAAVATGPPDDEPCPFAAVASEGFGMSDVLAMAATVFGDGEGTTCQVSHFFHKLANLDQIYEHMLCSAPHVVNYSSTHSGTEHLF
jgi:hypothetical protein